MNNEFQVLLGDNPFFGIDHLSQDRARERQKILSDMNKVGDVIEFAYQKGVRGFVVSTHPELADLIKVLEKRNNLITNLEFYPIIPYAQGYVNSVTQKGMVGALKDVLSRGKTHNKIKILIDGSIGFAKKDFEKLFKIIIDIEMLSLLHTNNKIIFLHDAITDLALGLEMPNIISNFMKHIKNKYKVKPGLVTKNLPLLITKLKEWKFEFPTIMTSFNLIGNQMNPSIDKYEKCVMMHNLDLIAMNVLAGGYLQPYDAITYLDKIKPNYVVFGMSNKAHIETITQIVGKK